MVSNICVLDYIPFLGWAKALKMQGLLLPSEYKSIKKQIKKHDTEYGDIVLLDVAILANDVFVNDPARFEALFAELVMATRFTSFTTRSGYFYVKVV